MKEVRVSQSFRPKHCVNNLKKLAAVAPTAPTTSSNITNPSSGGSSSAFASSLGMGAAGVNKYLAGRSGVTATSATQNVSTGSGEVSCASFDKVAKVISSLSGLPTSASGSNISHISAHSSVYKPK